MPNKATALRKPQARTSGHKLVHTVQQRMSGGMPVHSG
jgi:hypothetical protein